jgi:hypothetical protein
MMTWKKRESKASFFQGDVRPSIAYDLSMRVMESGTQRIIPLYISDSFSTLEVSMRKAVCRDITPKASSAPTAGEIVSCPLHLELTRRVCLA